MEKITCTIEHITYQNPENGYVVLQASVKGYRENQTLVGGTMCNYITFLPPCV